MHRIDTDTAQADKFGAGKNGFTGGNPQTGRLPTALDEDFFDAVQEELCSVIEGAGIAPVKGSNGQVLAALKALLQPLNDNLSAFAGLTGAADRLAYFTAAKTLAVTPLTAVGRNIISKATVAEVLAYLGIGDGSLIPVGVPVPYFSATPPSGWLKCNGASFSAAAYPKLAAAYPSLVLPDMRGEFIRGWDDGRGVDSGRKLLSPQDASSVGYYAGNANGSVFNSILNPDSSYIANPNWAQLATTMNGSIGQTNYAVRPRNVAFNYIIKAA